MLEDDGRGRCACVMFGVDLNVGLVSDAVSKFVRRAFEIRKVAFLY